MLVVAEVLRPLPSKEIRPDRFWNQPLRLVGAKRPVVVTAVIRPRASAPPRGPIQGRR